MAEGQGGGLGPLASWGGGVDLAGVGVQPTPTSPYKDRCDYIGPPGTSGLAAPPQDPSSLPPQTSPFVSRIIASRD